MKTPVLLSLVLAAGVVAAQAEPVALVSHRALYRVTLESTRQGGMVAVQGASVIEFRDACTGWTTSQRFVADMADSRASTTHSDFTVASREDKQGKQIRFKVSNFVNGKRMQRFDGIGILASAGGEVRLTSPKGQRFSLPTGTLLPTQHTMAVLNAALSGKDSFRQIVFQGGDKSELYDATTVIGRPVAPAKLAEDQKADGDHLLKTVKAWPTLTSYFGHEGAGDRPDYSIAYRLYANGVISSMELIYPRFTMKAELVKLEKLPAKC